LRQRRTCESWGRKKTSLQNLRKVRKTSRPYKRTRPTVLVIKSVNSSTHGLILKPDVRASEAYRPQRPQASQLHPTWRQSPTPKLRRFGSV
jgi:hypothetical protein